MLASGPQGLEQSLYTTKNACIGEAGYRSLVERLEEDLDCRAICGEQGTCLRRCGETARLAAAPLLNTCYDEARLAELSEKLEGIARGLEERRVSGLLALPVLLTLANAYNMLKPEAYWLWELTRRRLGMPRHLWKGNTAVLLYVIADRVAHRPWQTKFRSMLS